MKFSWGKNLSLSKDLQDKKVRSMHVCRKCIPGKGRASAKTLWSEILGLPEKRQRDSRSGGETSREYSGS